MYRTVLVPLDSSEAAARGLSEAIGLARAMRSRLVLLHVIDDLPTLVAMSATVSEPQMRQAPQQEAQSLLQHARARAARHDVEAEIIVRQVAGSGVADAIIEEAERHACELIVMGTHGRKGLTHLVLGSDAEAVVRRSPLPVLLVRCGDQDVIELDSLAQTVEA